MAGLEDSIMQGFDARRFLKDLEDSMDNFVKNSKDKEVSRLLADECIEAHRKGIERCLL